MDSGLLHTLLNQPTRDDLESHPKVGAEQDLLVIRGSQRRGYEIKRRTSPQVTPSMRSALADLRLSFLDVIHAGESTFPLAEGIRAVTTRAIRGLRVSFTERSYPPGQKLLVL